MTVGEYAKLNAKITLLKENSHWAHTHGYLLLYLIMLLNN